MNAPLQEATSHVTAVFYSIAIAVAVLSVISLLVAKTVGGKTKRQQQLTTKLVFAIGMMLFAIIFLPRILGAA